MPPRPMATLGQVQGCSDATTEVIRHAMVLPDRLFHFYRRVNLPLNEL